MDFIKKINPSSKVNPDTGFSTQASQIGGRFVNKDGSFNIRNTGWSRFKIMSLYSHLLEIRWPQFLLFILIFYGLVNFFLHAYT